MKTGQRKTVRAALAAVLSLVTLLSAGWTVTARANDTTIEIGSGKNANPIAENLEFTTFRGVSLTGSFKGLDPDGDALTFEITGMPKKGAVVPGEGGEFVYTPKDGSKGKDTFSYVAVDVNGGVSQSATVTVSIKKQATKTSYADMEDNTAHYAALVLAEEGVFIGEKLGGEYFFRPSEPVSRGEFLAMCLSVTGAETLDGITKTGFSDDNSIPLWVKPYVSAALMQGIVGGYRDSLGRLVFAPQAPVTFSEAAVILNKALGITDVTGVAALDTETVPAWAQSAAVNLVSCKILPSGLAGIASNSVTRADAAKMLVASAELLAARERGGGLLGWAK
jgi:hypothetical protein